MPSIRYDEWNENQDDSQFEPISRRRGERQAVPLPPKPKRRANERGEFKCGRCRAFIGPTVSGGRHRNHCPLCLASRHVDRSRPGDRLSDCGGMMPAVGTFFRSNGEQMVLHRCNGCGIERQNRIAADDNQLALLRLEVVQPPRRTGAGNGKENVA